MAEKEYQTEEEPEREQYQARKREAESTFLKKRIGLDEPIIHEDAPATSL